MLSSIQSWIFSDTTGKHSSQVEISSYRCTHDVHGNILYWDVLGIYLLWVGICMEVYAGNWCTQMCVLNTAKPVWTQPLWLGNLTNICWIKALVPRKMAQAVGTWNPGWMGHWDLQSQHQNGMLMHLLTLHRSLSFYMSGGKHVQDCAGIYIYISAGIQEYAPPRSRKQLALSSQCVSDLTPSS